MILINSNVVKSDGKNGIPAKHSKVVLEFFNFGASHLLGVNLRLFLGNFERSIASNVKFTQGRVEDQKLRVDDSSFQPLSVKSDDDGGVITTDTVDIRRRSYFYISLTIGTMNDIYSLYLTVQRKGKKLTLYKRTKLFGYGSVLIV